MTYSKYRILGPSLLMTQVVFQYERSNPGGTDR